MAAASAAAAAATYRFYKVVPLARTQGDSASCTVISMLLIDYFLYSATPTRYDIERIIDDGRKLYAQMLSRSVFASNRNTFYRGDDGQTRFHGGTNYVSAKDAYEAMRVAPWGRLQNIAEFEDIPGINLPPITDFDGLMADNSRPAVVDLALTNRDFHMKVSIDAGVDALSALALALEPGEAIAGALTTGAGVSGHTISLAIYKLGDHSLRYHAVETLGCDPRTGVVSKTSTQAAWITSDGDIGIRQYIREAFPPCRRQDALLALYDMKEDGTNGLDFLYNILTFKRRVVPPIELESRSIVSPGQPAFSLRMLPSHYRVL